MSEFKAFLEADELLGAFIVRATSARFFRVEHDLNEMRERIEAELGDTQGDALRALASELRNVHGSIDALYKRLDKLENPR